MTVVEYNKIPIAGTNKTQKIKLYTENIFTPSF